jgi:hypothetical protein
MLSRHSYVIDVIMTAIFCQIIVGLAEQEPTSSFASFIKHSKTQMEEKLIISKDKENGLCEFLNSQSLP